MIDVFIKNAVVVDGTNGPAYKGNIAIAGGKIVDIGLLDVGDAATVIDATDKVITPGFIDMHSHADFSLLVAPEGQSLVQQGITTVVVGQCGLSPAPMTRKNRREAQKTIRSIGAPKSSITMDKVGAFEAYLAYLESLQPAVNVVPLVGQGMVRSAVLGYGSKVPDAEDLAAMQGWVQEAMDSGAFGISTGLIYPPGSFSTTAELVEVVKPVAKFDGLYFSHIRSEAGTLLESIDEAVQIGAEAGVRVQISHFKAAGEENWSLAVKGLERIEDARVKGIDVTADMYPYTAGSTHLGALLPKWALRGGMRGMVRRLILPWERRRIITAMKDGEGGVVEAIDWEKVLICRSPKPEYLLRNIADLADEEGKDPYIWVLDALLKTLGDLGMVVILMSEGNIKTQLEHPQIMIGTDGFGMATEGPISEGMLHPRCFGTYPRLYGKYVREEQILSIEEATWKASGFPAKKLGLKDRGMIKKGYCADLVIFDMQTISDTATYTDPLQYPVGIDYVLINGKTALRHGDLNSKRWGKVIRKEAF